MNFNRTITPLKFYDNLTPEQFEQLVPQEHVFYHVVGVGLYKGEELVAVENAEQYVNNQFADVNIGVSSGENATLFININGGEPFQILTPNSSIMTDIILHEDDQKEG